MFFFENFRHIDSYQHKDKYRRLVDIHSVMVFILNKNHIFTYQELSRTSNRNKISNETNLYF